MNKVLLFLLGVFILSNSSLLFAADVKTIKVGECTLDVSVMQTPAEHSRGLLGYTDDTFMHQGMLFEMRSKNMLIFHTIGMKMPIYIIGVKQIDNNTYAVVTDAKFSPPGLDAVRINAPDVLEIPQEKMTVDIRLCLGVK